MATCGSCGAELPGNSRFCSQCGAAASSEAFDTRTVATTTPQAPSESRFLPGALLAGRYRIVSLLGRGGMGEVYRADDLTLGQPVALKFLPETLVRNPEAIARFRNEVRIARQVSHPNVCRVYDVGEVEGHFFLSMEYVDGEDLGSLLRRIGRLPADKALEIGRKLCAGLAAAHEKGVLHRDLKPANVMLDGRGQILLTDFGVAGLAGQIAGADVRSGTPAYMAPEQLAGEEVSVKSDIYSLGLVLYEIFTGKLPFESDTLAGLMRARTSTAPADPSTLVRELDPAVARVILRCLEPRPARRPASALAVAAALPGGDPLAAALAAGETPSPEMVAAAGEGTGLAPRSAVPLFAAALAGLAVCAVLAYRSSALEKLRPEYPPEVLAQKARDVVRRLGYTRTPADATHGFYWEDSYIGYVQGHDKPHPRWNEVLAARPSPLRFWYRQSDHPLLGIEFHSDLLTPGIVTAGDPPPILSGMISVALDAQGNLVDFEAMPAQRFEPEKPPSPAVDWNALFAAAGLDPTQLKPAEPLWTWLETSDTRVAWTGTWPGSGRPLRVEGAALRGRPVVFSLIGPWRDTDRMPAPESSDRGEVYFVVLGLMAVVLSLGAALLARRNLARQRGDLRGAFRLAFAIFSVHMALWVCRSHLVISIGTLGRFFLALCTSVFYGVVVWTVYLALEPYVRRYWPQTLISWTSVLNGHARDPIVGRDVLIGAALGLALHLIGQSINLWMAGPAPAPDLVSTDFLLGARSTLGGWLNPAPYGVRNALLFFFALFLLRVLLRNQWLAAAGFTLLWALLSFLGSPQHPIFSAAVSLLIWGLQMLVVLQWGLLPWAVALCLALLLPGVPVTANPSAWYFPSSVFVLASVVVLTGWAFFTSIAGHSLWKREWFE